ncbi:hypothetical protein J0A67_04880 [Algoriphagus aestuariicola]|uniref:Class I SAM-dependent methyltransferase n=1 Tax=Algoriphagus aestuariicola TaxID=1852016 RepID=A0ABS3BMD6_9BACT|nr:hypothetical protein [Algoriphagus aestuariicola]MBN7800182.1 hypothetical protein [Algoriphagus aestuariicola]
MAYTFKERLNSTFNIIDSMILYSLKKIRNKIFGINELNRVIRESNDSLARVFEFRQRETKAILLLKEYFPEKFVPDTSFSMSYQAIQHILNDILVSKPKRILEFGTGISTVIISNFLRKNSLDTSFISVDNDLNWVNLIENHISDSKKGIIFPFELKINSEFSLGNSGTWYDIPDDHLITQEGFDLIIVDGPFGGICKHSRYGALKFLKKFDLINQKTIVFVDDTNRPDELFLIDSLFSELGFTERKDFMRYSRLSFGDHCFTNPS